MRSGRPGRASARVWDEGSQFRLGLVVSGDRRLEGFCGPSPRLGQALLAGPEGGVSHIVFLMLGRAPARRASAACPSSELLEERVAWVADGTGGSRLLEADLEPMDAVVALWLSIDGDATGSKYEVPVESIELHPLLPS